MPHAAPQIVDGRNRRRRAVLVIQALSVLGAVTLMVAMCWWGLMRESVHTAGRRGSLIGMTPGQVGFWCSGSADPRPVVSGFDRTYTTSVWLDLSTVTAIKLENGRITGSATMIVNVDDPACVTVEDVRSYGTCPPVVLQW